MGTPERSLRDDLAAVALVEASQLCRGMLSDDLAKLYASGFVCECAPDDTIVSQGQQSGDLYMVVDGSVVVSRTTAGQSVELATLKRQGVFGEMEALTGQPCAATVRARTRTKLIRFPADVVRAVADTAPKFGRRLAALMAGRSKDAERRGAEAS
jgi:CRP-like cAMP-binding protein